MDSFWDNLIGHFKTKSAWVFMPALLLVIGFIIVGSCIPDQVPPEYFIYALTGAGVLALALVWRGIRRARAQRRNKFRREELSRDEMNKARSKLVHRNKLKI
jgi:hypothetical protein